MLLLKRSYKVDKFELRIAIQESVDKLLSLRFLQIEKFKINKQLLSVQLLESKDFFENITDLLNNYISIKF